MREFVFDVEYRGETCPLMSVFADYPALSSEGFHGTVEGGVWLVERFTGPAAALDAVEDGLRTELSAIETVTETACDLTSSVSVVRRTDDERDVYVSIDDLGACTSVHSLAARYLGTDALFEVRRTERTESWRIVHPADRKVGLFYDALQGALRDSLAFGFDHVGDATGWRPPPLSGVEMPPEQRAALVEAVEHGYYESPREISLDDLADLLDVPRSTLSYRLRRAEARLAEAFVASAGDHQSTFPVSPGTLE